MAHRWRIGHLCVTIPNQWTLEFEDVYTQLLAQAFDWTLEKSKARITYYTETDSIANYLFTCDDYMYVQVARLLRGRDQQMAVLVVDFGGTIW